MPLFLLSQASALGLMEKRRMSWHVQFSLSHCMVKTVVLLTVSLVDQVRFQLAKFYVYCFLKLLF